MEAPRIYKLIVKRFEESTFNKEIGVGKARFIMRFRFRVPSQECRHVFKEMEDFGLIKLNFPHNIKLLQK